MDAKTATAAASTNVKPLQSQSRGGEKTNSKVPRRNTGTLTPNEPEMKLSVKEKTISPRKRASRPKEVRRTESGRPAPGGVNGSATKSRARANNLVKNSVDDEEDSDRISTKVGEAAVQLFTNQTEDKGLKRAKIGSN